MNNEKADKQMNFWMFLDKNKYILIAFILIVILIILFRGYSIETPYFSIGKVPDTLFVEKEVQLPQDTIFEEKIVTKYVEAPKKEKSTNVKNGETEIEVKDQPANINTGSNSGIIGNNNTVNNFGEQPIGLNEADKRELIKLVNIELRKLPKNVVPKISVVGTTGNKRSMELAKLIWEYLKSEGYHLEGSVSSAMFFGDNLEGVKIHSTGELVEVNVFIV